MLGLLLIVLCLLNKTIAKDRYAIISRIHFESPYFVSFVEWYLELGFDRIIFIQNDMEPLVEFNCSVSPGVSVEIYRDNSRVIPDKLMDKYVDYVRNSGHKWVFIVDLDEYLMLDRAKYIDIDSFVTSKEREHGSIDVFHFRWAMIDYLYPMCHNGSMREMLSSVKTFGCHLVKSMTKVKRIESALNSHVPTLFNSTTTSPVVYIEGKILNKLDPRQVITANSYQEHVLVHHYTRSLSSMVNKAMSTGFADKRAQNHHLLVQFISGDAKSQNLSQFINTIGKKASVLGNTKPKCVKLDHFLSYSNLMNTKLCNREQERQIQEKTFCSFTKNMSPQPGIHVNCHELSRQFSFLAERISAEYLEAGNYTQKC